jgi:hypothetical protein
LSVPHHHSIDTRKHGKPDMVKLTYRLVKEYNAEAVCIISNKTLTDKVVYGMVSRGIPAFGAPLSYVIPIINHSHLRSIGAIWDS